MFWKMIISLGKRLEKFRNFPSKRSQIFIKLSQKIGKSFYFDIFIYGQNHFDFTLKHHRTSFSSQIILYTNYEEIGNFEPKS